jgi:hypothetical protein
LNAVGATLNPKVRVVINIKNRGAGLPDGGLFTANQLKKLGGDEAMQEPASFKGQQPERGVLEVKGAKEEIRRVAESEQVRRYPNAYGQVMVTNLREFVLVTKDANGALSFGESYGLAASEKELWEMVKHPRELAGKHETAFTEYLKRVMLTQAPLDTETQVSGVTTGAIRPELRNLAVIRRADGAGALNPEAGDLDVRAGWGHRGKGGVVMPGKGRLSTRSYTLDDLSATVLGAQTHDVYLNDAAMWRNIPERVWDYTIGGYQVIKKWLSYREKEILGRGLSADEAREVTHTARRIAAILLLEQKLDENYEMVKAGCYDWKESNK